MSKHGFGLLGFVGVVEDRMDPKQLGRVRVRCFGMHTEDLCNDSGSDSTQSGSGSGKPRCIDTSQLPWATVSIPTSYGAMNGVGMSSTGLVEGTWVFGMFVDGEAAQQPIVLGSLPGIPECVNPKGDPDVSFDACDILSLQTQGFYDPRKADDNQLDDVPRPPKLLNLKKPCESSGSENQEDEDKNSFTGYNGQSHNPAQKESSDEDLAAGVGEVYACLEETESGENYPLAGKMEYENRKGSFFLEPDTNRLAQRYDDDDDEQEKQDKTVIKWKKDNLDKEVKTANIPDRTTEIPEKCEFNVGPNSPRFRDSSCPKKTKSEGGKWEEPETPYDAKYPYNHVRETESGHIEEWDDTPGAERYHRFHRSGTFKEIHPDGTEVNKIVGERYTIIATNDKIHIEANCDITIDKAAKILVNADNQPGNHFDIEVGANSDLNVISKGDINLHAEKNLNLSAGEDITFNGGRDVIWRVTGDVDEHIRGNEDVTVLGDVDRAITGARTELISGSDGYRQEIEKGNYFQGIEGTSYVISGGLMTEIGLGNITMNPLDRPSIVPFEISPEPACTPVPRCGDDGGGTQNEDLSADDISGGLSGSGTQNEDIS